jgi:lipoprotein NlpD
MKRINAVEILMMVILITGCTLTIGTKYPAKKSSAHSTAGKHATASKTAQKPSVTGTYHKVRKGENLYRIAKYYEVQIADIRAANNMTSDSLVVGQRLFIPGSKKQQPIFALTPEVASTIPDKKPPEFVQETVVQQPVVRTEKYLWPVDGKLICNYGEFGNKGIDILVQPGKTVCAASSGKVAFIGTTVKYGETVIIEHEDEIYTVYGHDLIIRVKQDQKIKAGDVIGEMKNGSQSRRYLHFEVRKRNQPVNPWNFLEKKP